MAYQMAFFATDSLEILQTAITKGTVSYPAYAFIRDAENEQSGQLVFVDKNNEVKKVKGDVKKQVLTVESLPDASDGDKEVLYICNGVVYSFDGEKYIPAYKDCTSEIEDLTQRVVALENADTTLTNQLEALETKVEELESNSGFTFTELE